MDGTDGRGKPDSRDEAQLGDEGAESEQDGHRGQHRLGILRGHTFIHLGNRPFSFLPLLLGAHGRHFVGSRGARIPRSTEGAGGATRASPWWKAAVDTTWGHENGGFA